MLEDFLSRRPYWARRDRDRLERVIGLRARADACVKGGVLTPNQIAEMMTAADLADGVADGKLDPRTLRPRRES
jgi:hypothetical protein